MACDDQVVDLTELERRQRRFASGDTLSTSVSASFLTQRGHRPFDEATALAAFVWTDLDDLVGALFRQLLAQPWHGSIGARHHGVLDLFFAHDFVERIDHLLDVKYMEVVGTAPIARLRRSSLRDAAGLFADDSRSVSPPKTTMRALLVLSITAA